MHQLPYHNHKGFTLIETLFAVLIFSAALVSLMVIAGKGIAAAVGAREQITAHYLAQEGIEVVRNIRDFNRSQGGWDEDIIRCEESSPCNVFYNGGTTIPTIVACLGTECIVKESEGAFVDNGNDSPYMRMIHLVPRYSDTSGSPTEYQVISKVSWSTKGLARSVTLRTILKRW